jgi:hypothetical protein
MTWLVHYDACAGEKSSISSFGGGLLEIVDIDPRST